MDSGASATITGCREDFLELEANPSVPLQGVGGTLETGLPVAFRGILRKNNLALRQALYLPNLPVRGLISVGDLVGSGCLVTLSGNDPNLFWKDSGRIIKISWNQNLPVVNFDLFPEISNNLPESVQICHSDSSQIGNHRLGCAQIDLICAGIKPPRESDEETALAKHRDFAHLKVDGIEVSCPDCLQAKGRRTSHAIRRSPQPAVIPLEQINVDFIGPFSPTVRGVRFFFVAICDISAFCWVIPIKTKNLAVEKMEAIFREVTAGDTFNLGERVIRRVRSDNEAIFRSQDWRTVLSKYGAAESHSVPFCPQQNGVIERFVGTVKASIRANLVSVDRKLACYAGEFMASRWNQIPRNFRRYPEGDGKSPAQIRTEHVSRRRQGRVPSAAVEPSALESVDSGLGASDESNILPFSGESGTGDGPTGAQNLERSGEHNSDQFLGADFSKFKPVSGKILEIFGMDKNQKKISDFQKKTSGMPRKLSDLKRFGVLAYILEQNSTQKRDFKPTFVKAVYLGESNLCSAFRFGRLALNRFIPGDYRWVESESISAHFTKTPVRNLSDLRPEEEPLFETAIPEIDRKDLGDDFQDLKSHLSVDLGVVSDTPEISIGTSGGPPDGENDDSGKISDLKISGGEEILEKVPKIRKTPPKTKNLNQKKSPPKLTKVSPEKRATYRKTYKDNIINRSRAARDNYKKKRLVSERARRARVKARKVGLFVDPSWSHRSSFSSGGVSDSESTGSDQTSDSESTEGVGVVRKRNPHRFRDKDFRSPENLFPVRKEKVGTYGNPIEIIDSDSDLEIIKDSSELPRRENFPSQVRRNLPIFPFSEVSGADSSPPILGTDGWEDESAHARAPYSEIYANVPLKQALNSPNKSEWIKALDKEWDKLMSAGTWRDLTYAEKSKNKQILPLTLVLTQKRDGTYKARSCVLGNLVDKTEMDLFSPTISMVAHRLTLIEIAAKKDFLLGFDIDNAFLNAPIEDEVYIIIPEVWRDKISGSPVKRLVKALYGLPQAPRAWQKMYSEFLVKNGWIVSRFEPGMYKKPSKKYPKEYLKLSVYVDDNIMGGPDKPELKAEVQIILNRFSGRFLEGSSFGGTFLKYDFLGADFLYDQANGRARLSMGSYIEKAAERYGINSGLKTRSPNFDEFPVDDDSQEKSPENLREILGTLQWCATVSRPDVARSINLLARQCCKPNTVPRQKSALKILSFLLATKDHGISYGPQFSENFVNEYYWDGHEGGSDVPILNLFSDASFGSGSDEFHSVTGTLLLYRGVPLYWKSSKQGILSYSTCQAEWIAASDSIRFCENLGFLNFYLGEEGWGGLPQNLTIWLDSDSAIKVAKSDELTSKTKHYVLRYHQVRQYSSQVRFCRTDRQKADGLTKSVTPEQRKLLLGGEGTIELTNLW